MMRELNHEEAFAALDAAALDALDGAERMAVMAHAEGCAICRAEFDSLRATAAQLAFSTALNADTPTASRGRVRSRLMSRISAEKKPARPQPPTMVTLPTGTLVDTPDHVAPPSHAKPAKVISYPESGWRTAEWVALAAGIMFAASLGLVGAMWQERDRLQTALEANATRTQIAESVTDSLRSVVAARDSLIAGVAGRNVAMMTLTSAAARSPYARMFWDQTRNTWTLIAHNLPALKPGRTYQLWLVTPNAKISAGTFAARGGDAIVQATYALAPDSLRAIAVTEEPAGGVPQPTGAPVIAASATK